MSKRRHDSDRMQVEGEGENSYETTFLSCCSHANWLEGMNCALVVSVLTHIAIFGRSESTLHAVRQIDMIYLMMKYRSGNSLIHAPFFITLETVILYQYTSPEFVFVIMTFF